MPLASSRSTISPRHDSGGRLRTRSGQLLLEARVRGGARRDVGAQRRAPARRRPTAGESRRRRDREQAFGIAAVDPARTTPAIRAATAPPRVHRHDAALAQRIAATVERFVHRARERQQPLAHGVRRSPRASWRRRCSPLSWSVAIVCSPRPSDPRPIQHIAMPARSNCAARELERAFGQPVVEARDHPRQRPARPPPARRARATARECRPRTGRSVGKSGARRSADDSSRTDSRCSSNRSRSDTTPATRPPSSVTHHVADAVLRHQQRGVGRRRRGRQRDRGTLITSPIGVARSAARQHDATDHVLPREDAERPAVAVDDRQRADPPLFHRRQRLLDRRGGRDRHRREPQTSSDSGVAMSRRSVMPPTYSACTRARSTSSR